MKVLLLAAGCGTRISRYLKNKPKCLMPINDEQTLISYTIKKFKEFGITDIAISLGYQAKLMQKELENEDIKYYYNPFFDVTNSIASIWFAKEFIKDDDIIIMNSDVFLSASLFAPIINATQNPVLFADNSRKKEADYKFYYENNILLKYGKDLSEEDTSGEYIGLAKLKKEFLPKFNERMQQMIFSQQHEKWWEDVLYSLAGEINIYVQELEDFWAEIDYIEDYQRIIEYNSSLK